MKIFKYFLILFFMLSSTLHAKPIKLLETPLPEWVAVFTARLAIDDGEVIVKAVAREPEVGITPEVAGIRLSLDADGYSYEPPTKHKDYDILASNHLEYWNDYEGKDEDSSDGIIVYVYENGEWIICANVEETMENIPIIPTHYIIRANHSEGCRLSTRINKRLGIVSLIVPDKAPVKTEE